MAADDLTRAIAARRIRCDRPGRTDQPPLSDRPRRPSVRDAAIRGAASRSSSGLERRPGRDPAVNPRRCSVGVDFGTESARAVLVDCRRRTRARRSRSTTIATASSTTRLPAPDDDVVLGPDWALQDPNDYLDTFRTGRPPAGRSEAGIDPAEVIGIGIDFTACTMLPTTADGTPLCLLEPYRARPTRLGEAVEASRGPARGRRHQPVARELDEPWLERYGGRISSEWFFPKALQILREAPELYRAADRLGRGGRLGRLAADRDRDAEQCTAGYKALVDADGLPGSRLLRGARARLRDRRRRQDVTLASRRSDEGPAA